MLETGQMAIRWQDCLGYCFGMKQILDFVFCSSDQAFGQKKDRNVSFSLAFGRRRVKERFLGESFESHSFISDLPVSNIH